MRLILTGSNDPYYNLAAEEYYLRECAEDVFMLWQNAPVVVIGKNQNMYAEVKLEYTESHGILVARRITGGGAVYHDLGNVNYTFITSREKANVLDFAYFTEPILKALAGLGIEAKLSGRNDLLARVEAEENPADVSETGDSFEADAFAKFSGNAMTATKDRILNHGTLLFDSDLSVLEKTLNPDEEKLRKRAIKSVRSRVTNLKPLVDRPMETPEFLEYLIRFIEGEFHCRREEADRLTILATGLYDRNRSDDYNAGRREPFDAERRHRFPSGLVVLLWNEFEGRMQDVRIEGDFFGKKDVAELAAALNGVLPERSAVWKRLSGTDVSEYLSGITTKEWIEALF
ncbi:MAG: lipoate--protein ligase [Lachnospiraceae bacterium]|nr:lipoate--protein ligase [Lachnospiraceae bacterium]